MRRSLMKQKTVASKVQVERPVLRRSLGKSFHNVMGQPDKTISVLLQRATVQKLSLSLTQDDRKTTVSSRHRFYREINYQVQ